MSKKVLFGQFTPSEVERLVVLTEELCEAAQAACKMQRHGYESSHPDYYETNRQQLERELGDVVALMSILVKNGDIDVDRILDAANKKLSNVSDYLHEDHKFPSFIELGRLSG